MPAVRLKLLLDALQVMLGIWGNSDSNNIKHWQPVVAADWPPSADLQWDEASSSCRNIARGLQVGPIRPTLATHKCGCTCMPWAVRLCLVKQ